MDEQPLESALITLRRHLASSGEIEAADSLDDLLTATAAASELLSALGRRDELAAEFHLDILQRHTEGMRPLRFRVEQDQPQVEAGFSGPCSDAAPAPDEEVDDPLGT